MTVSSTRPARLVRVRSIAVLLAAVGAVALSGLAAPAASAGSSEEIRTTGAWAKFDDLGEELMVGDIAKDGRGARAYLRRNGDNSASEYVGGYAEPLDTRDH